MMKHSDTTQSAIKKKQLAIYKLDESRTDGNWNTWAEHISSFVYWIEFHIPIPKKFLLGLLTKTKKNPT